MIAVFSSRYFMSLVLLCVFAGYVERSVITSIFAERSRKLLSTGRWCFFCALCLQRGGGLALVSFREIPFCIKNCYRLKSAPKPAQYRFAFLSLQIFRLPFFSFFFFFSMKQKKACSSAFLSRY
uniref:Uncharacterized protein n=1 Tax=Eutreptiella gymnastica TaxID=73025 RepID=A0A7S4CT42_9EUGL